jgi:chromosome segregation ATPase
MTDSIQHAARAVAEAEAAANSAADNLAEAHRRADELRGRKSQLGTERDAIAADRRAGGKIDCGRLAVIQLDLEDIDALITAASNSVAELQAKADAARATVDARRQAVQFQGDLVLLDGSKQHATALAEKLLAAINEINATAARLGRGNRPEWAPSPELALLMRRLDLNRGAIRGAIR